MSPPNSARLLLARRRLLPLLLLAGALAGCGKRGNLRLPRADEVEAADEE